MSNFKKSVLAVAAMGIFGVANATASGAPITYADVNYKTIIGGQEFATYTPLSQATHTYFFNGAMVSAEKFAEELRKAILGTGGGAVPIAEPIADADAKAKAAAEAAAEAARKENARVAERTRKTNATVAGAVAINIVTEELFGEMMKEEGVAAAASVGGHFEKPELNIGASVDLAKHFGEDFEGVSVNAGFGVESGEISVGARKTWRVAEYVTASAGATIGAQGVRVGPEVMICNGQFGIGVAMWGPIPVPQVKIFGYTASVVPHLALANAVVGGATIAYKAVRTEMKKADAFVKAVEDAVEPAVEVAAQEIAHDGPSD